MKKSAAFQHTIDALANSSANICFMAALPVIASLDLVVHGICSIKFAENLHIYIVKGIYPFF